MAKRTTTKHGSKEPIKPCERKDRKRPNKPPIGSVTPGTDLDKGKKKTGQHDRRLVLAGKPGHTSFEEAAVSPYAHERVKLRTTIEAPASAPRL